MFCENEWSDWGFKCELELDHSGQHMGSIGTRLAYWGPKVKDWVKA